MQCMWYALECSNSHLRQRQWGRALKRLHEVAGVRPATERAPFHDAGGGSRCCARGFRGHAIQHFADITDDQLDFHAYCMRKMTLRAYIG